ncbi:DNA damage response protein WSS1-like protein [Perkinsela sp. CCAP 1560/4]|nr:DNA damage response protein WSS1-like protein [Perkinsela sp. CCAP 1560/4]|eukprot:KNH06585.1 DNA damage response protein WSS1-like protein [Perkinsela sp. CCAP 1560/4]
MANIIRIDDIITIKALGNPEDKESYDILKSLVGAVQPLIRRENLRVGTVEEFFPKNQNLLGLNHGGGLKIQIRLRRSMKSKKREFYPVNELIGTLVHELVHNRISGHTKLFYQTMSEWCEFLHNHWRAVTCSMSTQPNYMGQSLVLPRIEAAARKLGSNSCTESTPRGLKQRDDIQPERRKLARDTEHMILDNRQVTEPKKQASRAAVRRLMY